MLQFKQHRQSFLLVLRVGEKRYEVAAEETEIQKIFADAAQDQGSKNNDGEVVMDNSLRRFDLHVEYGVVKFSLHEVCANCPGSMVEHLVCRVQTASCKLDSSFD